MDTQAFPPSGNSVKCSNCGGSSCSSVVSQSSGGTWLRSVKQKRDELELDNQFSVPGSDYDSVARVEIENECAALREVLSRQQQAVQDLYAELEEERNAASSAANEAMSMILRLQREKAEIQMEARQFKRIAEEKTSHDQQELLALEDLLYKREQTIHSLTCEVQAYKHRLMSFGLTEEEAEGGDQYEFPPCDYPPLKCDVMHAATDADNDDTDIEKYVFGETPRDRLKNLENRISQMERSPTYSQVDGDFTGKNVLEKVVVGQSPRWNRHAKKISCDSTSFGPDFVMDSPKHNSSFRKTDCFTLSEDNPNLKKVDNVSEAGGDDMIDRVYTIDSVHSGAPYNGSTELKAGAGAYDDYAATPRETGDNADFEDPYIKKLCMRLQALEADRESMRQAIISMRTDKAQIVLLKEIAQHLCKEMSPQRKMTVRNPSIVGLSFLTAFKWITSIVFWRKRARQIRYMFGLPSDSAGLLMLLDKGPGVRAWRCLSSTQLGD